MSLPWELAHDLCDVCGDLAKLAKAPGILAADGPEHTQEIRLCAACLEDARLTLEHATETEPEEEEPAKKGGADFCKCGHIRAFHRRKKYWGEGACKECPKTGSACHEFVRRTDEPR